MDNENVATLTGQHVTVTTMAGEHFSFMVTGVRIDQDQVDVSTTEDEARGKRKFIPGMRRITLTLEM